MSTSTDTNHRPRSKDVVSRNMAQIKRRGSEIERLLGSAMWSIGLRYRKQYKMTGRPDFAFPGVKVAVFADSDFWHGRDWETAKNDIKTNRDFWIPKIERNIRRDAEVNRALTDDGWIVLRYWEDEIKEDPFRCAGGVKAVVDSRRSAPQSTKNVANARVQ